MDRDQAIKLMQDLLRRVVERKGSDLFITAGFPPAIKIDGEIRPQTDKSLTPEQSATLTRAIMNDKQTRDFDSTKECQFAIAPPGIGRFRASAFIQQGFTGCVIRTINAKIPTIEDLELPQILKDVALTKRGLVRLFALKLDDDVAGIYYGFHHRRCASYYLGGFNPASSYYRVGIFLFAHAITSALREGADIFDFLRGGDAYKYDWGARDKWNQRRLISRRQPWTTQVHNAALSVCSFGAKRLH